MPHCLGLPTRAQGATEGQGHPLSPAQQTRGPGVPPAPPGCTSEPTASSLPLTLRHPMCLQTMRLRFQRRLQDGSQSHCAQNSKGLSPRMWGFLPRSSRV